MADRAAKSTFIRYANSDTQKVNEKYLGLVEIVGSKGAETLCTKICEVFVSKYISIPQLCFHGLDGTNAISGKRSGLYWRLKHGAPHSKYVNCRNHRLAFVFVHLIPMFESLQKVDTNILTAWKAIKYSSIRAFIFGEAQNVKGLKNVTLLNAATMCWQSHGEASVKHGSLFKAHTLPFLLLAQEKMELSWWLCYNNLMSADDSLDKKITDFKIRGKAPFMKELPKELDRAMWIDDNIFLAFDVFNMQI